MIFYFYNLYNRKNVQKLYEGVQQTEKTRAPTKIR